MPSSAQTLSIHLLPLRPTEMMQYGAAYSSPRSVTTVKPSPVLRTEAIGVRYADIAISVRLWADKTFRQETLEETLREIFTPRGERIGAGVTRDEITARLQKLTGVMQIERVELRGLDQNSYQTAAGDLTVMPDTILHLTGTTVTLTKDRR